MFGLGGLKQEWMVGGDGIGDKDAWSLPPCLLQLPI